MLQRLHGPSGGALLALLAMGWGSNQFAPLIVMYQSELGVNAAQAQGMFVLYAVGLVPGLFIGGRWSDHRGRAPVVMLALIGVSVSSALLMCGPAAHAWLHLGRLLAGLACGIGFSAGTAWVKETTSGHHGPRRAVAAMTFGFAGGPLIVGLLASGLVAAGARAPAVWVYVPHLVLVAVTLVVISRTYGRVDASAAGPAVDLEERDGGLGLRDPRFAWIVLPLAPWVFITASIALAILPGAIHSSGTGDPLTFSALVTPLPAIAGVSIQMLVARLHEKLTHLLATAMSLATGGLLLGAWAVTAQSLTLTVVACIVLGLSYGACQTCGLHEVMRASPPEQLGRNTAIYQALTYLGYLIPLPIALLVPHVSLIGILVGLAAIAGLTLALVVSANIRIEARTP
ncbi:MFS transporter [Promicromonospora aerolata]|uniref:MFS transporter n=1 Tax=Promicromonospora aerolata TaxID=195749 RepID=A0ABW4VFJ6_9MICO